MINILGINHKTAPLDIRGVFAFSNEEIVPLADKIQQETDITELVVLCTCNRTEIYYCNPKAYHSKETNRVLLGILHHFKRSRIHCEEYFYSYNGEEAIKHLFRVTSGMDSMVVGEDQIMKQVKDAYLYCTKQNLTDAVLMRLFQKSFEVGKRVRTETDIQHGPRSVSYVAVDMCLKEVDDISDKQILLIGLGDTGSRALKNLYKKGAKNIYLCNRTYKKSENLAKECGNIAVPFEEYKQYLAKSDIVITATTFTEHLIEKQDVEYALAKGEKSSQLYIDLSVPRNVDNVVAEVENVKLYGVDDLMVIINEHGQKREDSMKEAEVIISEMTKEYLEWLDVRALKPVIQAITKNIKKINDIELQNYKGCYSSEAYKAVVEYSERLTQKYIRAFIKKLKQFSSDGSASHMLKTINELFLFEDELPAKLKKEIEEIVNK